MLQLKNNKKLQKFANKQEKYFYIALYLKWKICTCKHTANFYFHFWFFMAHILENFA